MNGTFEPRVAGFTFKRNSFGIVDHCLPKLFCVVPWQIEVAFLQKQLEQLQMFLHVLFVGETEKE